MAIQQDLLNAVAQKEIPVEVVPDVPITTSPGYGQELTNKAKPGSGLYQYGATPSTYSRMAPGTKTKARMEHEDNAKKAAEKERRAKEVANAIQVKPPAIPQVKNNTPTTSAGGDLDSWLLQALEATGQSADLLPYLRTMAIKESSGRPDAINKWDSNWKAGHPSKGLLQTIDSTFNAHKLPGHDDIWNPVDNAIAAIRYAVSRYGSLENVPGIKAMARGGKYIGY